MVFVWWFDISGRSQFSNCYCFETSPKWLLGGPLPRMFTRFSCYTIMVPWSFFNMVIYLTWDIKILKRCTLYIFITNDESLKQRFWSRYYSWLCFYCVVQISDVYCLAVHDSNDQTSVWNAMEMKQILTQQLFSLRPLYAGSLYLNSTLGFQDKKKLFA